MNRMIDGKFSRHLNPAKIEYGWHNRLSPAFMPIAQLYATDGESFAMTFSSSWDINGLKHALKIEVHRIDPQCLILWSEE